VVQATGVPLSASSSWVTGGTATAAGGGTTGYGNGHGRGQRLRCLHHGVVMAAMVWMLAALSRMSAGSTAMAAMSTGGGSAETSRVVGVYCVAAAAVLLMVGVRGRRRIVAGHGSLADDVCHALMTAGMGVAVLAMV
jgi:Domain of unknown function (DUF5134)